jgi:hypothetical protein
VKPDFGHFTSFITIEVVEVFNYFDGVPDEERMMSMDVCYELSFIEVDAIFGLG